MLLIETGRRLFEQEDRNDLVFEDAAPEQPIRDLCQELKPSFLAYRAPETERQPPQVSCVPAMRFYFFFKEPLHAFGMFGGTFALKNAADFSSDAGGCDLAFGHLTRSELQFTAHMLNRGPSDLDYLVPAALAGGNSDRRAR